ncbi:MAG: hypothetical protein KME32_00145 [Mojavia pulchra JT2-VF2]|jgi:hypothetical protein|uniref:Uncharacterized protein n=1 Tax=Mojavia pulchra JT2-VF2 TaxID=287848 RepID=A0A951PV04_9NOST|nr:hypothetical protein [Mojavia pulchra JT2-VF2]
MSKPNPNFHTVKQDGTINLHSNHLGDVLDVGIDLAKRRFYGVKLDGFRIEDDGDCGNDIAQPVMLYNMNYHFETNTWRFKYHLRGKKEADGKEGFKTAREAWLYREALIAGGIAER